MEFLDLETAFNRALHYAFSLRKVLFVFPFLFVCALLCTFCRTISLNSGMWVSLSMLFTPLLLSSGILLALGIILVRMYYHEVKNLSYDIKQILHLSWDLILASAYLSVPMLLTYLVLWFALGIFMALREIPTIGEQLGAFVSFVPFLLILSSLGLFLVSLLILFFATPMLALHKNAKKNKAILIFRAFSQQSFRMLCCFLLGLIPLVLLIITIAFSAYLTNVSYVGDTKGVTLIISSLFITLPISFLLSPALIFFFNFAAESHQLILRQKKI